jgi:hypothetical protein
MMDSELDPKSKRESNRTKAIFDRRPMRFISPERKEICCRLPDFWPRRPREPPNAKLRRQLPT